MHFPYIYRFDCNIFRQVRGLRKFRASAPMQVILRSLRKRWKSEFHARIALEKHAHIGTHTEILQLVAKIS